MIKLKINKVNNDVVVYQGEETIYTFMRSNNEINTKNFVDTLKLNHTAQLEYEIDYSKVAEANKDDIFSNYVHDYLTRFLKDVKTYLDSKKVIVVPKNEEEVLQKSLIVGDEDLPF